MGSNSANRTRLSSEEIIALCITNYEGAASHILGPDGKSLVGFAQRLVPVDNDPWTGRARPIASDTLHILEDTILPLPSA